MAGDYEIITNKTGRKILVLKQPISVDKDTDLTYGDFDAIFSEYHRDYVRDTVVIWYNLPMFSRKGWLKPCFLSEKFSERFSKYAAVVDGFAISPLDEDMTNRIEEIITAVDGSGVSRVKEKVKSDEDLFINVLRCCYTRGIETMANTTIKTYAVGYTKVLSALFGEGDFIDTRLAFEQNMIDFNYIRKKTFVDKIYLCPTCRDSHMMFVESCPKCQSSDIHNERVIHHFRCANISPESTYQFDGEMRCPKCKRFLRHIGVDYDAPANVYTCNSCGNSFMNPAMRVTCTHCLNTMAPEKLSAFNVEEYELTDEGKRALLTTEMRINMRRDAFDGYADYDSFLNTMRTMAYSNGRRTGFVIIVGRFTMLGSGDLIKDNQNSIIQPLFYRLPSFKFTINGDHVYVMQITREEEVTSKAEDIHKILSDILSSALGEEVVKKGFFKVFVRKNGDRSVPFIKELERAD